MKRNWWLILTMIIALALTFPYVFKQETPRVKIDDKTYLVEIAKTDMEHVKGLSNRNYLAPNAGMLFIFEKNDIYTFWMKDTKIPLDILWIELDPSTTFGTTKGRIVEIATLNPPTDDNIPKYTPKNKANYVLELNANSGIKIGDEIKIEI